jgi:hypothetical protein
MFIMEIFHGYRISGTDVILPLLDRIFCSNSNSPTSAEMSLPNLPITGKSNLITSDDEQNNEILSFHCDDCEECFSSVM